MQFSLFQRLLCHALLTIDIRDSVFLSNLKRACTTIKRPFEVLDGSKKNRRHPTSVLCLLMFTTIYENSEPCLTKPKNYKGDVRHCPVHEAVGKTIAQGNENN